MMRIFVAVPFPTSVKHQIKTLCQVHIPAARWEHAEDFHLTLRFIGEVDEAAYKHYVAALKAIEAETFHLALRGVGRFPQEPKRPPKVLWVGVMVSPELLALQRAVSVALETNGLNKDKFDTYHPHITLARFRHDQSLEGLSQFLEQHAAFEITPIPIVSFGMYQTQQHGGQAKYHLLEHFPLKQD